MTAIQDPVETPMETQINRNGTHGSLAAPPSEESSYGPVMFEGIEATRPVSRPTILPSDSPMPVTQNRTLLGEELALLMGQARQSGEEGVSGAPPCSGISLRVEKTPAEFAHLYAALERQSSGLGGAAGLRSEVLGTGSPYVLGVTSAVRGEGKTTVALHLAMTIARDTWKKVCLLDMSLGSTDLAARLGMPATGEGVVAVLEASGTVVPTLQLAGCDNLVIIPAGRAPSNAAKLARSPRVEQLLVSARFAFDVIIVDLPSVSSDNAGPLVRAMDGVLVVVRAGATPQTVVSRALDMLGRDKVLGVTLNRVPSPRSRWGRSK